MKAIKVAYQGQPGAYSDLAAKKYFGPKVKTVGKNTFEQIFEAVKNKKADFAMVPIENSTAGSVHENYDLLAQYNVSIVGEMMLRISHNLLVIPLKGENKKKRLKIIKRVYSHPQALKQCRGFFKKNPHLKPIQAEDTAGSAKNLSESVNLDEAAIASVEAAKIYSLQILQKGIETNQHNYTRFLIISLKRKRKRSDLGKVGPSWKKSSKVSLIFSLAHKPGSLFQALKVFADRKINLTKIESRPIMDKPWDYLFYLDFEINKIKECQAAIKELKKYTHYFKTLGCYQKGRNYVS
jgi:prephenate dehydratase